MVTCLAICAAGPSWGQSPFDDASLPGSNGQPPTVRGLYDPTQPAVTPAGPAGFESAPAATFVAPTGRADMNTGSDSITPTISAEAKPIEGSQIVARVDGQVILASDVLWQVNQIIAVNRDKIPPDQIEVARQALLRQQVMGSIDRKLLFADFRRTVPAENMPKIEETISEPFEATEVPRLIKLLKVNDRVELDARLKESGTSVKDVQRQFTEQTIAGEWMRQRTPKPKPISHEAMLAYYNDHLKEYENPAQARWEEIMVRFDRCGGDRDAAWKALAEMGNEVWQAASANPTLRGPVFGGVAKAKSHGFTAADGGVHDWTKLGDLKCEAMNEALATLAPGQLSDGIESEQGFHIVRVLERKEAGRTPFTEAQAKIRETLEQEQKQALVAAEIAKLRKTARVWTVFDGEINGARLSELLEDKQRR